MDKSRFHFKLFPVETLQCLEENGIKLVLKADQKKAIEQFFLPTSYGKVPISQLFVLLVRGGNYASYVSYNTSFQNYQQPNYGS